MNRIAVLLLVLGVSTPAFAQSAQPAQPSPGLPPVAKTVSLAGPRFGVTMLNDQLVEKLKAEDIKEWIVDPDAAAKKHSSTKKPAMPKTFAKLPPADVDALVAYLQTLK